MKLKTLKYINIAILYSLVLKVGEYSIRKMREVKKIGRARKIKKVIEKIR